MLHLAVKLNPPRKGSNLAKMRPRDFLQSDPVKKRLKQTLFDDFDPKELLLDPTPQEDHETIELYHKDVSEKLGSDRKELQVLLPFRKKWEDMQAQLDALRAEQRSQEAKLRAELLVPRLKLCIGNLLVAMGKLALGNKANDKASTHSLQQSLQFKSVKTKFKKADIPSKFWPYLNDISTVYCCFLGSPWL